MCLYVPIFSHTLDKGIVGKHRDWIGIDKDELGCWVFRLWTREAVIRGNTTLDLMLIVCGQARIQMVGPNQEADDGMNCLTRLTRRCIPWICLGYQKLWQLEVQETKLVGRFMLLRPHVSVYLFLYPKTWRSTFLLPTRHTRPWQYGQRSTWIEYIKSMVLV